MALSWKVNPRSRGLVMHVLVKMRSLNLRLLPLVLWCLTSHGTVGMRLSPTDTRSNAHTRSMLQPRGHEGSAPMSRSTLPTSKQWARPCPSSWRRSTAPAGNYVQSGLAHRPKRGALPGPSVGADGIGSWRRYAAARPRCQIRDTRRELVPRGFGLLSLSRRAVSCRVAERHRGVP
ncbi:hypothetical protein IEO21_04584 [Rhodonia placenta]|uniref:Uncharacterized protein n=1 Tax=Rhodonia placenta TaxID=104341 RepID=A0A8H7P3S4_9APHY|nr:hypothetical protein IEO21_04584 [Postia placenta]